MAEDDRIELTYRLWSTGADESFEEYIEHLRSLLPRHRGLMERRVRPVDDAPTTPDALVVFSFPDVPSIDGFLRDPLRGDAEDLAGVDSHAHHAYPDLGVFFDLHGLVGRDVLVLPHGFKRHVVFDELVRDEQVQRPRFREEPGSRRTW